MPPPLCSPWEQLRLLCSYGKKTFLNPNDDVSLLRIANVPARGLSDVTMERLLAASHERKCSVFAAMKNPVVTATFQGQARSAIERFVELVERQRAQLAAGTPAQGPRPLQSWADRLLEEIGYFADLNRMERNAEAAENRIRSLKEIMSTLDGSEGLATPPVDRLHQFLEEITLDTDREEEDEEPGNAVTLITMHSCKGLEFPHVYVVGLEDGLLPHSRSKEESTLDEERRLFYVAITRAMQTLTISHCGSRKKYGQPMPCHPSPFLNELPDELVERGDKKASQPVPPSSGKTMFNALRAALD